MRPITTLFAKRTRLRTVMTMLDRLVVRMLVGDGASWGESLLLMGGMGSCVVILAVEAFTGRESSSIALKCCNMILDEKISK